MAGASFLKGYFDHAEADEFVSLVNGRGGAEEFKAIAKQYGVTRPVRSVFRSETAKIFPLDSIFISTPNFLSSCGSDHILGIIHILSAV